MIARICAALAIAVGCHGTGDPVPPAPGAPARAAAVAPADAAERVILTGTLRATDAIDLVVPVTDESSLAIRWLAADGTQVKAGDRVVELDSRPFAGKLADHHTQLASAESQLRVMRTSHAAQLADKQAAVRRAEIERDRVKLRAGLPADLVTARAAQDAALRLIQAEAELQKLERERVAATAELALEDQIKRIELDKTRRTIAAAEQAIAALVLVAPRDGIVAIHPRPEDGRGYRAGDVVQQGTAIAALPDLTRAMEVRADLIDVDDGKVALHEAATCTLDAYPAEPMACSVAALSPVARAKPGRDALRRAFEVTLVLDHRDHRDHRDPAHLRPGMSVKVELGGRS